MSSYYPSFNYMGLNSQKDKNLRVVAFDVDQGEKDTFLGMESIYTESAYGTHRIDYGAKYNSVATIKISVIKPDASDFTVAEVRDFLRWTTGARKVSYLDLLIGDEIKFSFLGRVTNAYQQKLDARTIGLAIEFTSISPWAYSPQQTIDCSFDQKLFVDEDGVLIMDEDATSFTVDSQGVVYANTFVADNVFEVISDGTIYIDNSTILTIDNPTDDLYTYVNLDVVFTNASGTDLSIKNTTLDEETIISGLSVNETVMLNAGQFITSDKPNKIFGDNFNFIWPRLAPGDNKFIISGAGKGQIDFSYRYPIKIGDCAIDIEEMLNNINCNY